MNLLPPEVCDVCRADAPDHWMTDLWFYCSHNRVMVRRRRRADAWTIDRHVKPKQAQKHLSAALALMAGWMRENNVDPATAEQLMAWYRTRDPDR